MASTQAASGSGGPAAVSSGSGGVTATSAASNPTGSNTKAASSRPSFKPTAVSEPAYEFLLSELWRWVVEQEAKSKENEDKNGKGNDNDDGDDDDEEEEQEVKEERAILAAERAAARIERIGYDVGYRLCERLAQAKPLAPPPPSIGGTSGPLGISSGGGNATSGLSSAADGGQGTTAQSSTSASSLSPSVASSQLEAVKFLCKEFWMVIFRKQIDKLQTNHRGVFVLKDFDLRWLRRLPNDDEQSRVAAIKMLAYPCGLVRGALANLGIASVVSCDFLVDGKNMSACSFNIKVKS